MLTKVVINFSLVNKIRLRINRSAAKHVGVDANPNLVTIPPTPMVYSQFITPLNVHCFCLQTLAGQPITVLQSTEVLSEN